MNPLEAMARRVATDPFFMGAVLADYARAEGLDDAGLCGVLGCRAEDLPMLQLCRAPRDDVQGFREDVTDIAQRFGLEESRLISVIRLGQVVCRLQKVSETSSEPGFLLAARDAQAPAPEPDS